MTNFDRVDNMTSDQLAEWLCLEVAECGGKCPGYMRCIPGDGCANGLKKWLKQTLPDEKERLLADSGLHECTTHNIENWPKYKKASCNVNIATSKHAKKIDI
jgi:hypothetical protein